MHTHYRFQASTKLASASAEDIPLDGWSGGKRYQGRQGMLGCSLKPPFYYLLEINYRDRYRVDAQITSKRRSKTGGTVTEIIFTRLPVCMGR